MIIERKYVSFFQLSQSDSKAKEIFEGTIIKNVPDQKEAQKLIDYHYSERTMVYGAEMGYCIPHFDEIVKGFEALDKEEPYDNGFSITDTTGVKIEDFGEDYIDLLFVKTFDGEEFIIKAKKVYNEE